MTHPEATDYLAGAGTILSLLLVVFLLAFMFGFSPFLAIRLHRLVISYWDFYVHSIKKERKRISRFMAMNSI